MQFRPDDSIWAFDIRSGTERFQCYGGYDVFLTGFIRMQKNGFPQNGVVYFEEEFMTTKGVPLIFPEGAKLEFDELCRVIVK